MLLARGEIAWRLRGHESFQPRLHSTNTVLMLLKDLIPKRYFYDQERQLS